MKIVIVASYLASVLNFRIDLVRALILEGCDVHVLVPESDSAENDLLAHFSTFDCKVAFYHISRTSRNPIDDVRTFFSLFFLLRNIRPNLVFCYTIKPVIYGLLAASILNIPGRVALITGLGFSFIDRVKGSHGRLKALICWMYRVSLSRASLVFFQNVDDENLFRKLDLFPNSVPSFVVNGSGVDLDHFAYSPVPVGPIHFLFVGRLLVDKGILEFVGAAQVLKARRSDLIFSVAGWIDENPAAISQSELDDWVESKVISYLGRLEDVRPAIRACSVFVLPSYREGVPRSVLEAIALGRAIITTDAPGCRETAIDGENGFLVPVGSTNALVDAMCRFINDPLLTERMGRCSRVLAERRFNVHDVNAIMIRKMKL